MRTTDWEFDFSSMFDWELRERRWDVYDEFYELPQEDALCCIYSVTEASMMNYIGHFAILRNKKNPQLALNITNYAFQPGFSSSHDGSILFLQPQIYDSVSSRMLTPILILDIRKDRFSYLLYDNYNPCYQILQPDDTVFVVDADENQRKHDKGLKTIHGKTIKLNRLKWCDMDSVHNLREMIFGR